MRKYILIRVLLVVFVMLGLEMVMAQRSSSMGMNIRRADRLYNEFNFHAARELYERSAKKQIDNLYIQGRIGNCYKFQNEIGKAEEWYASVARSSNTDPIYKFYYSQSLAANGKYDLALDWRNQYYQSIGKGEYVSTNYPADLFTEDEKYSIKIEDFNTEYADFSPYRIKDQVFFVSNRNQGNGLLSVEDMWSERPFTQLYTVTKPIEMEGVVGYSDEIEAAQRASEKKKKTKVEVYNKASVSNRYHEGPVSLDRLQNDLYMTRSNYTKKAKIEKGENNEVNLKIVKMAFVMDGSKNEGEYGSVMVNNTTFSSDNYSVAYPAISHDGKYMVFASDMPGGYGGLDLYVAENVNGMWSNPINLGDLINTPGNEGYPFMMSTGVLYFSSDGHFGLGGYDLYESKLGDDGYFQSPVNLRAPMNSNYDDFGFWMNDTYTKGFFTSNRPSDYGDDDIYSFDRRGFMFEAVVYDSKTEDELPQSTVTLINLDTNQEVVLETDQNGYVSHDISPNTNYKLTVVKEGYLPEEAEFISGEDDIYAEIPLVKDYGIMLDVTVIDKNTKREIPYADVLLTNMKTEEDIAVQANKFGKATFTIDPDQEYRIKASKELENQDSIYFAVIEEFNTYGTKAPAHLYTTIELEKICAREDCQIIIKNILYDLNKYYIRPDAALILDNLVKVLKDNPTIEIELASHTDCRSSYKYNMELSAKRAEAAVNYLIEKGIDYRRLTAAGYGETQLLDVPGYPGFKCSCEPNGPGKSDSRCTEAVHQLNRRTTFSITKR